VRLPGVGKKLSQRLVVELGEELRQRGLTTENVGIAAVAVPPVVRDEVLAAMEALGYRQADCLATVARVVAREPEGTVEQVLKDVLREMHG
jgi:Holliday junction resolvasome RuvABC DNA-binding subunit